MAAGMDDDTGAVLVPRIISAASSNRSRASHRRSSVRSGARWGTETKERKGKDTETGRMAGKSEKEERRKYEELIFNVFVTGISALAGTAGWQAALAAARPGITAC